VEGHQAILEQPGLPTIPCKVRSDENAATRVTRLLGRLLFLHAHRKTEDRVKYILGMNAVAAQPNISDDYFKSKRAAFLNALKCKTGLILAKSRCHGINASSDPVCPPSVPRFLRVAKCLCMLVLLIMKFAPPAPEHVHLLGEGLLQSSKGLVPFSLC
jgi:hypothetical protein